MPLLARHLACFYCGKRTKTSWTQGLRHFDCDKCAATNYLDDRGQVADPPATPTKPIFQPARAPTRATSPESDQSADSLFCSTCLTNQHLYTRNLAEYFPDESHPDYAKYEAGYDAYKKGLEKRYPQVCAECEPRALARMRQASYEAKSDHLRRMMDLTRRGLGWSAKVSTRRWLLLTLGCWMWWLSVLGQGLWHMAGAAQADDITEYDYAADQRGGWSRCMLQGANGWSVKGECQRQAVPFVDWSLIFALLSFWWNPKLKEKMRGPYVRLYGLKEHFWLQVVVISLRAAAWTLLRTSSPTSFPPHIYRALHAVMAVFILLTTITSLRVVQIDKRPRKLFDDNIQPLLSENERQQQQKPLTASQPASSGTFPLHMLDGNEPLTPPPDDDAMSEAGSISTESTFSYDSNRMDWEPTQRDARFELTINGARPSFASQQRGQAYQNTAPSALGGPSNRPSPFFGTLPANPKGISPKGRQIVRPVPFMPPSEEKKQNFFAQVMNEKTPAADRAGHEQKEFSLAKPRLPADFGGSQEPTGLEDLFDRVFVSEDPPEVRDAQGASNATARKDIIRKSTTIVWKTAFFCLIPLAIGMAATVLKVTGWFDGGDSAWPETLHRAPPIGSMQHDEKIMSVAY